MPTFRIDMTMERLLTFYLEADDEEQVYGFLECNGDWNPGDTPGLIDVVGEEMERDVAVTEEDDVVPNFRITEDLELEEIEQ